MEGVALMTDDRSPAQEWDQEAARRSVDELFHMARRYRSSDAYFELMKFIARFRFYSPFNAMLVQIQMSGATFVAPAHRWLRDYGRRIKAGARPLVILQPMGPVMFVFDVSDTEPEGNGEALPQDVEHPFGAHDRQVGSLESTIENAKRDGVSVTERQAGSQSAGEIRTVQPGKHLRVLAKRKPAPEYVQVPLRYELLLNADHKGEQKYATLTHELAHLYCGHLGTPSRHWWPDRRGMHKTVREFEAESVCYLVCGRLGIDSRSEAYLTSFVAKEPETPPISLECVMKAAGLIEQMGRERLKLRKDRMSS